MAALVEELKVSVFWVGRWAERIAFVKGGEYVREALGQIAGPIRTLVRAIPEVDEPVQLPHAFRERVRVEEIKHSSIQSDNVWHNRAAAVDAPF